MQIANGTLPVLEQLSLGGRDTVKGYRKNFLLSDSGVFASAELQWTIVKIPNWQTVVKLAPFVNAGSGWNSSGNPNQNPNVLLSGGIGFLLQSADDRFNLRIDWGIPLISANSAGDSLQERGIYFAAFGTLNF